MGVGYALYHQLITTAINPELSKSTAGHLRGHHSQMPTNRAEGAFHQLLNPKNNTEIRASQLVSSTAEISLTGYSHTLADQRLVRSPCTCRRPSAAGGMHRRLLLYLFQAIV